MAEIQNIIELTFTEADGSAFAASALESANNAAESATNAFRYANAASASAEESSESATQASNSASDAITAKTNAETAAQQAETSATNAATSETNASNSATSASESAATATTKASEASQSATAASNTLVSVINNKNQTQQYYIEAMSYAGSAEGYANDATNSAFQADQSAQAASTSATNASTSANNAASSATTANSAADDATAAKTAAETAKTAAEQSATSAATSAQTAQQVKDSIPADYTELSDSVEDLKNAFGAVRDISDAVGVVFPYVVETGGLDFHANSKPTVSSYLSDRRGHTSVDFPLQLPTGTKIIPDPYFRFYLIYTADGNTYTNGGWKTSEYTLTSDLTVFLSLASAVGGEPNPLTPETLANSYTIVLPNGKTGLLGDVAKLTQDVSYLNSSVSDLAAYKNAIGNLLTQYLNASAWNINFYWNSSLVSTSANGYECIKVDGLKAGTYHFNRMSAPFTWFENVATGEVKRASTDYGLSDITTETEVTIDYDFNLYLTITGSHVSYGVMVTDGDMPESFLTTAQVYTFNLTEAFKTSVEKPIYCGSTREYTTLKSAIEEATKHMDSVVYVDAETFDLVSEFGTEWLENYAEEANCGLFLKNRVHVIFASGAKVVFNYTGSNEYIQRRFSPFNAGEHGFTLENAYVESTNCRYSVHDERGTDEDSYHNIYKRCTFIHDSTGTAWGSHQAIGGGLGKNGDVLIEDCYLTTAGTATTVSYHNSASNDAESKVVLKDSYLSNTSLISNYGASAKKSRMFVHGCSLKSDPMISVEAQYGDNVELVKWNNEIRG